MTGFLVTALYIVIIVAVMFLLMTLGRKFVFSKIRVNKWIILGITILSFVLQFIINPQNFWLKNLFTVVTVWFFLWFMEIQTTGGPKIEKKIVIRPKAKPNRVKHLKDQNK
ncbi:hypothetical protein [Clostridium isatidis]|uniref:Uncharacterized protein n=1 Tax=Clostridium isatidis TaxID=182773 RepID=A0A343JDL2_9CLOT|nr:hypothetical protein [Clostridium isatidis]ASW43620.1 hypothetical protein BEN51_09030 [Clostridium isatidis]NLZ35728.1 hypothetical protein [Clostridiales bacterium]